MGNKVENSYVGLRRLLLEIMDFKDFASAGSKEVRSTIVKLYIVLKKT